MRMHPLKNENSFFEGRVYHDSLSVQKHWQLYEALLKFHRKSNLIPFDDMP